MTTRRREAASLELFGRVLYDTAQVLESAEGAEERVLRALELLGQMVPYDQCALLDAEPGLSPRLLAVPAMQPAERDEVTVALVDLFGELLEEQTHANGPLSRGSGSRLAVPLIGLDQVIGVLFVRCGEGAYEKRHVQVLSVVAAKLAAYLTMLRARAEETKRTRKLEEVQRAAETASRAKDEFLKLVSEELKTPLAAALAWVRVLGSKELPEAERVRAVEAIERSVKAQAKLVDDLVDLAFIATEELRLDLRPIELAKSIEAAIDGLWPLAKQRSIRLEATLDPSVQPLVGDPERLDEVLTILLANAIKFTPDGGRVQIRLEPAGAGARIRVIDTGKGIDPDRLPHVFDRFTQEEKLPTRSYGGLGLAIAKHLVELHGGSIRAESAGEEKGATFTVELRTPTNRGALPALPAAGGSSRSRS
jgi:signal transduction histidine kinase